MVTGEVFQPLEVGRNGGAGGSSSSGGGGGGRYKNLPVMLRHDFEVTAEALGHAGK